MSAEIQNDIYRRTAKFALADLQSIRRSVVLHISVWAVELWIELLIELRVK